MLFLLLAILLVYTSIVASIHGFGLLPIFFDDIVKVTWRGQFNLDFLFMLILSSLWTAWRNRFSRIGMVLAFFALIGGSLFLTMYLLVLSWQTKGNFKQLLLGNR